MKKLGGKKFEAWKDNDAGNAVCRFTCNLSSQRI